MTPQHDPVNRPVTPQRDTVSRHVTPQCDPVNCSVTPRRDPVNRPATPQRDLVSHPVTPQDDTVSCPVIPQRDPVSRYVTPQRDPVSHPVTTQRDPISRPVAALCGRMQLAAMWLSTTTLVSLLQIWVITTTNGHWLIVCKYCWYLVLCIIFACTSWCNGLQNNSTLHWGFIRLFQSTLVVYLLQDKMYKSTGVPIYCMLTISHDGSYWSVLKH